MLTLATYVSQYTPCVDGGLVPDVNAPEQGLLWLIVGLVLMVVVVTLTWSRLRRSIA